MWIYKYRSAWVAGRRRHRLAQLHARIRCNKRAYADARFKEYMAAKEAEQTKKEEQIRAETAAAMPPWTARDFRKRPMPISLRGCRKSVNGPSDMLARAKRSALSRQMAAVAGSVDTVCVDTVCDAMAATAARGPVAASAAASVAATARATAIASGCAAASLSVIIAPDVAVAVTGVGHTIDVHLINGGRASFFTSPPTVAVLRALMAAHLNLEVEASARLPLQCGTGGRLTDDFTFPNNTTVTVTGSLLGGVATTRAAAASGASAGSGSGLPGCAAPTCNAEHLCRICALAKDDGWLPVRVRSSL
jgi:hypothetical protein